MTNSHFVVVIALVILYSEQVIGLHSNDNNRNISREKRQCPGAVGCDVPSHLPRIPGRTNCVLPEYVDNGEWKVFNGPPKFPGEIVPANTILKFQCDQAFKLLPEAEYSICNQQWSVIPICLKTCPSVESTELMQVGCTLYNVEISCNNPYDGTRARISCAPRHYDPSLKDQPYRHCRNGKWDAVFPRCVPESTSLAFESTNASTSCLLPEYPKHGSWQVSMQEGLKPYDAVAAFTFLIYICDTGYKLFPEVEYSICNKQWSVNPICIKTCQSIQSTEAMQASCTLSNMDVSCENPYDGTRARISCTPTHHDPTLKDRPYRKCSHGNWDAPLPQCKPGATNTSRDVTNSTSPCILPSHPSFGSWLVPMGEALKPGDTVAPFTVLTYNCERGYKLYPDVTNSICNNGWSIVPRCIKPCRSIESTEAIHASCDLDGVPTSCINPDDGTKARITCGTLYETITGDNDQYLTCFDGAWNWPFPICKPVCGLTSVDRSNITSGKIMNVPWAVIINENETQICSGSLISPNAVLTAAHCFKNPQNATYSVTTRNDGDNGNGQTLKIEQIVIHPSFRGLETFYKNDIALILLEKPVQITSKVLPVCLDIKLRSPMDAVNLNDTAFVSGISAIEMNRLKTVEVEYQPTINCVDLSSEVFRMFITDGQICATTRHKGDSIDSGFGGGGLVYLNADGRYYIRGITSIADTEGERPLTTALFSDTSFYRPFLSNTLWQYSWM